MVCDFRRFSLTFLAICIISPCAADPMQSPRPAFRLVIHARLAPYATRVRPPISLIAQPSNYLTRSISLRTLESFPSIAVDRRSFSRLIAFDGPVTVTTPITATPVALSLFARLPCLSGPRFPLHRRPVGTPGLNCDRRKQYDMPDLRFIFLIFRPATIVEPSVINGSLTVAATLNLSSVLVIQGGLLLTQDAVLVVGNNATAVVQGAVSLLQFLSSSFSLPGNLTFGSGSTVVFAGGTINVTGCTQFGGRLGIDPSTPTEGPVTVRHTSSSERLTIP